jgi:two-component sensor histidine kinase
MLLHGWTVVVTQHRMERLTAAAEAARLAVTSWAAPVGLCLLDADLRLVVVNDVFASLGDVPPAEHVGQAMWATMPALAPLIEPKCREALVSAEPMPAFEIEAPVPGARGSRWWLCRCHPVVESDGRVHGVTCALVDITERKRIAQAQQHLMHEVGRRSRSLLEVVLSTIRLTAAEAPSDVEALVDVLEDRIAAVARAHALLSAVHWRGADLADILKAEAAAAGAHLRCGVPAAQPSESAAPGPAMMLYALAAHASRCGAVRSCRDLFRSENAMCPIPLRPGPHA